MFLRFIFSVFFHRSSMNLPFDHTQRWLTAVSLTDTNEWEQIFPFNLSSILKLPRWQIAHFERLALRTTLNKIWPLYVIVAANNGNAHREWTLDIGQLANGSPFHSSGSKQILYHSISHIKRNTFIYLCTLYNAQPMCMMSLSTVESFLHLLHNIISSFAYLQKCVHWSNYRWES